MRRSVVCLILALGVFCLRAEASVEHSAAEPGLIRLHVVAAGDSEADQRLKLAVRDACLALFEAYLHMSHQLY